MVGSANTFGRLIDARWGYSWALAGFEIAVITVLALVVSLGPESKGKHLVSHEPAETAYKAPGRKHWVEGLAESTGSKAQRGLRSARVEPRATSLLGNLAVVLACNLALFEDDGRTQKDTNQAEGGEREERDH